MPALIAPQLATAVATAPSGNIWLHEIKFDGYRLCVRLEDGEVHIFTRGGLDWTERFPTLARELGRLPAETAWLDGELVQLNASGASDFAALQAALSEGRDADLVYYVFDLMYLDGRDLRAQPLTERKQLLKRLVTKGRRAGWPHVQYSEEFAVDGKAFLQASCKLALEGIVSKLKSAAYREGRGTSWLKSKCHGRQEFVIGGYTESTTGQGIGSLLVGHYETAQKDKKKGGAGKKDDLGTPAFLYDGRVGTGFSQAFSHDLERRLQKLAIGSSPFATMRREDRRNAIWVQPQLVCELQFSTRTADGLLRHTSFLGLREDKRARDVGPDIAADAATATGTSSAAKNERAMSETRKAASKKVAKKAVKKKPTGSARSAALETTPVRRRSAARDQAEDNTVAGITISHPGRVIDPATGITKLELARYYDWIAPRLLGEIADRPVSLVRCPEGIGGAHFFQRHPAAGMEGKVTYIPEEIVTKAASKTSGRKRSGGRSSAAATEEEEEDLIGVADRTQLLTLIQFGVIELHPWGARTGALDIADRIIFDLDPDESLPFRIVTDAAKVVRKRLDELDLDSFPKTTGGKGMHVVVPLRPGHPWPVVKAAAKAIAAGLAQELPEVFVAHPGKERRKNRIFIDYLRNDRTATAVAAYSARARPGLPVAWPLTWNDVTAKLDPRAYSVSKLLARGGRLPPDPWKAMSSTRQSLTAARLKALGVEK